MSYFNTRLGSLQNLQEGETYDLYFCKFGQGFPVGKIDFKVGETPRKITGIQKVAQLFLKILLTAKGSDLLYPELGTLFPEYSIGANVGSNRDELGSIIESTIEDAYNQASKILNVAGVPAESTIRSVELLGIDFDEGMSVYMELMSGAGEKGLVSLPFPKLDLNINGNV